MSSCLTLEVDRFFGYAMPITHCLPGKYMQSSTNPVRGRFLCWNRCWGVNSRFYVWSRCDWPCRGCTSSCGDHPCRYTSNVDPGTRDGAGALTLESFTSRLSTSPHLCSKSGSANFPWSSPGGWKWWPKVALNQEKRWKRSKKYVES